MTLSMGDIANLVVAFVAVGGLLLSIYNLYTNQRDKKNTLKVDMNFGIVDYFSEFSVILVMLEVANASKEKIFISSIPAIIICGWFKDKKAVVFKDIQGTKNLPLELSPGDNASFWVPLKNLQTSFRNYGLLGKVKIKARFRDGVGNSFYSPKKLTVKV